MHGGFEPQQTITNKRSINMAKQYLLIGVGGTGARVLEAFTYLSAAGVLGADIPSVHMRMIEMDTDNGNLGRLSKVLDSYSRCHDSVFSYVQEWQSRKIIYKNTSPFTWQIGVQGNASTLNQKFNNNTENKSLLHGLFGSEDLELLLEEGCKGRPRIGALEYAKRFQDDIQPGNADAFWSRLFTGDLAAASGTGELTVMLVGSMFGGSGASGVPNIAKMIKRQFCNGAENKVGLMLMSPFYNFTDNAVFENKGAESKKFMINSKTALLYYDQSDLLDTLHSLYVVGGEVKPMRKMDGTPANDSTGSKSQCNPAMPAVLVAALSVLNFFKEATNENSGQVVISKTGSSEENNWGSYPYRSQLQEGINRLQRLSLMWRFVYNKIDVLDDWRIIHKKYKNLMSGTAFVPHGDFLKETEFIREFFLGHEKKSRVPENEPWNIGVEGFLQELERNGMGVMLNMLEEIQGVDGIDLSKTEVVPMGGKFFLDIFANFQRNSGISVGNLRDNEKRRARFIAGMTKACFS